MQVAVDPEAEILKLLKGAESDLVFVKHCLEFVNFELWDVPVQSVPS